MMPASVDLMMSPVSDVPSARGNVSARAAASRLKMQIAKIVRKMLCTPSFNKPRRSAKEN